MHTCIHAQEFHAPCDSLSIIRAMQKHTSARTHARTHTHTDTHTYTIISRTMQFLKHYPRLQNRIWVRKLCLCMRVIVILCTCVCVYIYIVCVCVYIYIYIYILRCIYMHKLSLRYHLSKVLRDKCTYIQNVSCVYVCAYIHTYMYHVYMYVRYHHNHVSTRDTFSLRISSCHERHMVCTSSAF